MPPQFYKYYYYYYFSNKLCLRKWSHPNPQKCQPYAPVTAAPSSMISSRSISMPDYLTFTFVDFWTFYVKYMIFLETNDHRRLNGICGLIVFSIVLSSLFLYLFRCGFLVCLSLIAMVSVVLFCCCCYFCLFFIAI